MDVALELGFKIKGYFDLVTNEINPFNINYWGSEKNSNFNSIVGDDFVFPSVGDNKLRSIFLNILHKNGIHECNIISSKSTISKTVEIGNSNFISFGATINSMTIIGNGCIVNTSAVVEHECKIGNFVHIAPNSTLCGNVQIGDYCTIGAGSTIKPNITIGRNVTIGSGASVICDIPDNEVWAGVPAKKLKLK